MHRQFASVGAMVKGCRKAALVDNQSVAACSRITASIAYFAARSSSACRTGLNDFRMSLTNLNELPEVPSTLAHRDAGVRVVRQGDARTPASVDGANGIVTRVLTIPFAPLVMEQAEVEYAYGPDSTARVDVTPGRIIELTINDPKAFPGTVRKVWVHIPSSLQLDRSSSWTMILDGSWYLDPAGAFRAGIVLDNLVADGSIRPMVGIFVDPGVFPGVADSDEHKNRNAEYDSPDGVFADFLADEVIPLVSRHLQLSPHPGEHLICGGSSGGNAAFTAAWSRPGVFGRVVCLGGSFAQMLGGNPYPHLIATTPRKPLRVLLTAAHRDIGWNEPEANWLAENLLNAAALAQAGYDFRFVLREGGHSMTNGGALLPDALRWAWNDTIDG